MQVHPPQPTDVSQQLGRYSYGGVGLLDSDDDVRAVAADSVQPVVDLLSEPQQAALAVMLWDALLDLVRLSLFDGLLLSWMVLQDDLTASTAAVLRLLSSLPIKA